MLPEEKETVITYSYGTDTATVYTFDVKMINKIKRSGEVPVKEGRYEGCPWAQFELDKRWIKVSKPVVRNDLKNKPVGSE